MPSVALLRDALEKRSHVAKSLMSGGFSTRLIRHLNKGVKKEVKNFIKNFSFYERRTLTITRQLTRRRNKPLKFTAKQLAIIRICCIVRHKAAAMKFFNYFVAFDFTLMIKNKNCCDKATQIIIIIIIRIIIKY